MTCENFESSCLLTTKSGIFSKIKSPKIFSKRKIIKLQFLIPAIKREPKRRSSSLVMSQGRIEEETPEELERPKVQVRLGPEPEHFVKMRPTSWSPPPVNKSQHQRPGSNVCKITVSPREPPPPPPSSSNLVHRLKVRMLLQGDVKHAGKPI